MTDYTNWSTDAANITTSWTNLKTALESAVTQDEADLEKTYEWAEEEYDDCGPADAEAERQNIETTFNDIKTAMWEAHDAAVKVWEQGANGKPGLKQDLNHPKVLADAAEAWTDDILATLGDHESVLEQSTTRMQWTGPGADAYAKRVPEQVAAMRDLKTHINNVHGGAQRSADTQAALLLEVKECVTAVKGYIQAVPPPDPTKNFAVRMDSARFYCDELTTQITEFTAGDADWRSDLAETAEHVSSSLSDAQQLNSEKWPVASSESLQDMEPGANSNLPETGAPPSTPPTTEVPDPTDSTPPSIESEDPEDYNGGADTQESAENYGEGGDQN